jgi:DNA (cytosine-5)-methyltransferase 1
MAKLKDTPISKRPRERFLTQGPDKLSKSELLAILLGSGIKGKNVTELSEQIIKKFGDNFLKTKVEDLEKISGIGKAKALQISAAFSLVERFLKEQTPKLRKEIKKDLQKTLFDYKYDIKNLLKENSNNKIKGVSLFSNVGIAETYFYKTNIDIVVANELLEERARFYKEMYPNTNVIVGDINNEKIYFEILKNAKKNNCEFVLITPPCQGMSVAGKMSKNDPRNFLTIKSIDFLNDLKPKYAIIENVPGILKTYLKIEKDVVKIVDYIEKSLKDYRVRYKVLDSSDFNTPQIRKRAIFLISRKDSPELFFPATNNKKITVRDAIGHLPSLESGEKSPIKYHYAKKHNERHILCMRNTPTGKTALNNKIFFPKKENGERAKGYATTYKRIEWDKPSPTITMANGSISSQNNVHPGRKNKDGTFSDARVLTLKEIFILTGLPEDWNPPIWASENLTRQVIGEGVPPKVLLEMVKQIK